MATQIILPIQKGQIPIIKASRREFVAACDHYAACDLCADDPSAFTNMFYIPLINQIYCENCLELWQKSAVYYKVDQKTIDKKFASMKTKMQDLGVWE